jgi:hypothetical protein
MLIIPGSRPENAVRGGSEQKFADERPPDQNW